MIGRRRVDRTQLLLVSIDRRRITRDRQFTVSKILVVRQSITLRFTYRSQRPTWRYTVHKWYALALERPMRSQDFPGGGALSFSSKVDDLFSHRYQYTYTA